MATPNMGLVLPTDHGSADVWDTILDAVFALVDAHDHTAGKGVAIPSAALNINADIQLASGGNHYAFFDAKAFDFFPVAASLVTSFAGALFMNSADNELYWRSAGGVNVKVTAGASLNVAAFVGGIGGDYSAVGALFSYDDATRRYLAQQEGSPRPWAGLASGNVDIYEQAALITNRVRLQSPHALAASYALTLPAALPAASAYLWSDPTGVVSAGGFTFNADLPLAFDGQSINISASSNFLSVLSSGTNWTWISAPVGDAGLIAGDKITQITVFWRAKGVGTATLRLKYYDTSTDTITEIQNDGGTTTTGVHSTSFIITTPLAITTAQRQFVEIDGPAAADKVTRVTLTVLR